MGRPSKRDIFQEGEHLGDCACDAGPNGSMESNGSKEHLIYYQGFYYFVYTDFPEGLIYRAHKLSDRQVLDLIFEGGSLGELILAHQRSGA